MRFRICVLMFALSVILMFGLSAKEYAFNSPDGQVSASFELKKGALFYSVSRDGIPATVIRRGKYKLIYYYEDQSSVQSKQLNIPI